MLAQMTLQAERHLLFWGVGLYDAVLAGTTPQAERHLQFSGVGL